MGFRYETHLHTSLVSACSGFTPEEIVEKYLRLGYQGVFVTDHFLNGNTTVPRDFPYERKIVRFGEGYRAVKRAAEGSGLDVFFSLEYSYYGTDFLVYGLDEEWLLEYPEIMTLRTVDFCRLARAAGAFVVQAHPYREAFYIDHIRLFPSEVDAIEVVNCHQDERPNRLAKVLADAYALPVTAGSDIHGKEQKTLAGMQFSHRLASSREYGELIRRGEGELFTLTDEVYL